MGVESETTARCPRHPELGALGACARCGTFVCGQCATTRADGQLMCPACQERTPQLELADRAARFWANLVDNSLILLPLLGGGAAEALLKDAHLPRGIFSAAGMMLMLGVLAYQAYLSKNGQSIGKRMRRIRVVRNDGGPASPMQIIVMRNLLPAAVTALMPFGQFLSIIDYAMIFGDERRCLHDLIANTKVVKVPTELLPSRSVSPEVRISG